MDLTVLLVLQREVASRLQILRQAQIEIGPHSSILSEIICTSVWISNRQLEIGPAVWAGVRFRNVIHFFETLRIEGQL